MLSLPMPSTGSPWRKESAELLHDVQAAGAIVVQDVAEGLASSGRRSTRCPRDWRRHRTPGLGTAARPRGAGIEATTTASLPRRVREAGQRPLREHKAAAAHVDGEAVPERQGPPSPSLQKTLESSEVRRRCPARSPPGGARPREGSSILAAAAESASS